MMSKTCLLNAFTETCEDKIMKTQHLFVSWLLPTWLYLVDSASLFCCRISSPPNLIHLVINLWQRSAFCHCRFCHYYHKRQAVLSSLDETVPLAELSHYISEKRNAKNYQIIKILHALLQETWHCLFTKLFVCFVISFFSVTTCSFSDPVSKSQNT